MTRALGRALWRWLGWRFEGQFPDLPKLVVIIAPHSSGWDFLIGISVVLAMGLEIHYLGKIELFRWPLGPLMRALGGIPIDRTQARGMVEQVAGEFERRERFVLALAPEGTRRPGATWKTGFYQIAVAAGVPILAASFDWRTRTVRLHQPLQPTGDPAADLAAVRARYAGIARRDGLVPVAAEP